MMNKPYFLSILISAVFLFNSCTKDDIGESDCQLLRNGIMTNNKEEVKTVINKIIASLNSQTHTEKNLKSLVSAINTQCETVVTLLCFNCIETLPSQSEIRISFAGSNETVRKVIDISYTAGNKMTFHNLHD